MDVIVKIKNYRALPSGGTIGDSWEEIVQCKDCKNAYLWVDKRTYHCGKDIGGDSSVHDGGWFCADGERKEKSGES